MVGALSSGGVGVRGGGGFSWGEGPHTFYAPPAPPISPKMHTKIVFVFGIAFGCQIASKMGSEIDKTSIKTVLS